MTPLSEIIVYIDYKSPYAYLAKDPVRVLAAAYGAVLIWKPYILDIPKYLGTARVGDDGRVLEENRNAHQWRRVRYSYMDCRRRARKQGLVIRGTQKIWDSTLAAAGMLFAQTQGDDVFHRYNDQVFDRFWRRELDIESASAIAGVLQDSGSGQADFLDWLPSGQTEVARIGQEAEVVGVFGVPSFIVDGELYWGSEHLSEIEAHLTSPGRPT